MLSGRLASTAVQGNGAIRILFAAAVIGGVSLNGGRGAPFGAFMDDVIILIALIVSRITSGTVQE